MPFSHIGINVSDIKQSCDFYLAALRPLGYKVIMSYVDGEVLGLGSGFGPDLWLASIKAPTADGSDKRHADGGPPSKSRERQVTGPVHLAFAASNREQVREFYKAAIAAGGKCNGPPGLRPEYFATYYGAFVFDPEGRNIEAVCMKPTFLAEPLGLVGWGAVGATLAASAAGTAKWLGWL